MKYVFVLTVAVWALFSCRRDLIAIPPDDTTPEEIQLKKLETDQQTYCIFMYDSLKRFKRMETWTMGIMNYVEPVYSGSEMIERILSGDFQIKPVYRGCKITSLGYLQHQTPGNDDPDVFETLRYDGNQIAERRRYEIEGEREVNIDKNSFTYYPNGDVKEISLWYFNNDENRFRLQSVLQMEYDARKNPLKKIVRSAPWLYTPYEMFQTFLFSAHNVTQIKCYDHAGELMVTKKFSYTCSAAGYPLTATEKWYGDTASDPGYVRSMKYSY